MSSLSSPVLLADGAIDSETSDAYLLEKFVTLRDETCFAALVRRHGSLVRGVCRRVLTDPAAADDAFQQTFLSLSKHAPSLLESVAPTASLGSWLYRVAVNASLQLKRKSKSRRRNETQFAENRPRAELPAEPWNDVLPVLNEEISALPGQHRLAVVKCHLEGKTQHDAAKEMGITYATLRRRLKEARGMLRTRLSDRGFAKNGFLLAPLLGMLAAGQSASAQTAASIAAKTTAGVAAAKSGKATAFAAKWLLSKAVINTFAVSMLVLGVAGTWWNSGDDTPATTATTNAKADKEATGDSVAKLAAEKTPELSEQEFWDNEFAYVYQNGHPVSPELENAMDALEDVDLGNVSETPDPLLDLGETMSDGRMLRDAHFGVKQPEEPQIFTDADDSLVKVAANDPNAALLLNPEPKAAPPVISPPEATGEPLSVEQVMELLNQAQDRHSSRGSRRSPSGNGQLLGYQKPAKTVKVIPLP